MNTILKTFVQSETGAVTVDWVVLTAVLVGLGLAVMAVVVTGVEDVTGETQAFLAEVDTGNNFTGVAVVGNPDLLAD